MMTSQSETPYPDPDAGFFSFPEQEVFNQAEFETLFCNGPFGRSDFVLGEYSDELSDSNTFFNKGISASAHSSNPSTASALDYSPLETSQSNPEYPTPGPISPHPYPLVQQLPIQSATATSQPVRRQRPLPMRSNKSSGSQSNQSQQSYNRRRSLSQSDADRITATDIPQVNPTFVRLQASRSRPDQSTHSRNAACYQHGRSASQGTGPRGRPLKNAVPTSVPHGYHSDHRLAGMMETSIGTPLHTIGDASESNFVSNGGSHQTHEAADDSPLFRRMRHPNELEKSRQVIEIGIMAVSSRNRVDSHPEQDARKSSLERMLTKLADLEQYLEHRHDDCEDALKGCAAIKEKLVARKQLGYTQVTSSASEHVKIAELAMSQPTSECEQELFGGDMDNVDLISMLMEETEEHGLDV